MAALPSFCKTTKKDNTSLLTKKDTVHIVGHAHQDMSWLWTYSETMKMANDNLRQVCAFIEEFPDFHMVQSEAAVYDFVERTDPEVFKKVQEYVADGHIEPVGGMWVESDQNMPSGEGFTRSLLLGQRYFQEKFGRMARVGWLPDDFGHTAQLPQMLKLSGQDYFFFMRAGAYPGSFWWKAPDGSTVLCYTAGSYNGGTSLKEYEDVFRIYSNGQKRVLHAVGNGDHGGGPSRDHINEIHAVDAQKKGAPAVKFTSAESFFKALSNEMEGRPTHEGEMQYVFEGCYTTVAENKEGNRNCERSLYQGEFFNAINWLAGDEYPGAEYRDIWRQVAFNQFHDILTGSAIYESNRENVARYKEALRKADELRDNAYRKSIDDIDYQTGLGQPVVAYNVHPYEHKSLVEATVYSYDMPATAELRSWPDYYGSKIVKSKQEGVYPTVLVRDCNGKEYPAQIVWGKTTPPYFESKVQFVCDDIPAGGYKTFYIDVAQPGIDNEPIKFEHNTFDTDFFKVKIDPATGDITSLILKETGTEFVKDGASLNTLRMFEERKDGGMKSWTINESVNVEDVTKVLPVAPSERDWTGALEKPGEQSENFVKIENGPVRATVEATKVWGKSKFIVRTYIYKSYPRVDYELDVHWLETGGDDVTSPMLRAVFPLAVEDTRFYCDVPYAVVERPGNGKFAGGEVPHNLKHTYENPSTVEKNQGQEVPAQRWVDVNNGNVGFSLMNRTKYGHAFHNNELRLTLMRSAGNPDIYPNLGRFVIEYSIYPHTGGWQNGVRQEGENYNSPVYAAEPLSRSFSRPVPKRPEQASLVSLDASNVELKSMKRSEDGDELAVRLCEMEGKETVVALTLPKDVKSARRLNLIEYPLEGAPAPTVFGNIGKFTIKPYEIVTLGLK